MISTSTLLTILIMLLKLIAPTTATDGHFSVILRLSALSPTPVRTTLILQGIKGEVTVTEKNTTDLTIDYSMSAMQVLDNAPIDLQVFAVTDRDYKEERVKIDRVSPRVNSIAGLIRIVSSGSKCAKNYYGPFCSFTCKDNEALHTTCTPEGMTVCMPGWQGEKCQERVCPVACKHGHCDGDRCLCRVGFTGVACDQCIPAAGCINGGCNNTTPGTCACHEGWSGPKCNIDLDLCKKRSPCAAGWECIVKAPGTTECICPEGKTGANCEITVEKQCPCKNGGHCLSINVRSGSPMCKCPFGFNGPTCERPIAATTGATQPANNHNWLLVLSAAQLLCLAVIVVAVVILMVVALRFIKSSRPCGGPAHLSDKEQQPLPKLSSVSLLMPDDLDPAPFSKGDELFSAAKEHSKKVVVFDTMDEPRYSACPKKSSIFSIPDPTFTEKTYETLPV